MTPHRLADLTPPESDEPDLCPPRCRLESAGSLDPMPRALWRVLHLGEAARFIAPIDHETVLEAFTGDGELVERELAELGCGRAELFLLVTLLAAGSRAVTMATLGEETFLAPDAVVLGLAQLDRCGAVLRTSKGVAITPAGRRLAVRATFRALDAAAYGSWGACGAIFR